MVRGAARARRGARRRRRRAAGRLCAAGRQASAGARRRAALPVGPGSATLASVRQRMAAAAIRSISLRAATGETGSTVRFGRWSGRLAQGLLFRSGLERKPVSMLRFRLTWPLIGQRSRLMPLVQPQGIYCFFSAGVRAAPRRADRWPRRGDRRRLTHPHALPSRARHLDRRHRRSLPGRPCTSPRRWSASMRGPRSPRTGRRWSSAAGRRRGTGSSERSSRPSMCAGTW